MEEFRKTYSEELKSLEVSEEEEVTLKLLSTKFKKKALKVHPDKTGEVSDDEEFKNLLNDYMTCMDALKLIVKEEVEKEYNDMAVFFAKHNVTKENINSYTVLIENEMNDDWKDAFKKMKLENEPKKLKHGGTQYKIEVLGNVVSISHYDNPSDGQSKLLIQGTMFHIKAFMIQNLPPMYQKMCMKTMKRNQKNNQPTQNISLRALQSKEINFNCDQCEATYKRKVNLVKHMQSKHDPSQEKKMKRASKVLIPSSPSNYIVPKGLSITSFTKPPVNKLVQDTDEKTKEKPKTTTTTVKVAANITESTEAMDAVTMNPLQDIEVQPLMQSINDLENELDNVLDSLQERAEEIIKEKTNVTSQLQTNKQNLETSIVYLTNSHTMSEDDGTGESTEEPTDIDNIEEDVIDNIEEDDIENIEEDVITMISRILTDMTNEVIPVPNWIQKGPKEHNEDPHKTVEFQIFKEFEDGKIKHNGNVLPEDVFVCGECGMFSFNMNKLEDHMERTHAATWSELTKDNKRAYKELGEMRANLYEVQGQVTELEETISEITGENLVKSETIKVQANMIVKLQVDLGIQEEEEEETNDANVQEVDHDEEATTEEEFQDENQEDDLEHRSCKQCDYVAAKVIFMKSHMLKHRGKFKCDKCRKIFNKKSELEEHLKKYHEAMGQLFQCIGCAAKFTAEHALKQHTKAVHKSQIFPVGHPERAVNQKNTNTFECRMCGEGCESGAGLDRHIVQCTRNRVRPLCTFFLQGRCTRGNLCNFSHQNYTDTGTNTRNICRRGPSCPFLFARKCFYFHPALPTTQPRQQFRRQEQEQSWHEQEQPWQEQEQSGQEQEQPWQEQQQLGQSRFWDQGPGGRMPTTCRRGPRCSYLAAGTCFYFHPGVGVQQPQDQGSQGGEGSRQRGQGGRQWAQGGCQGVQGGHQGSQGDRQWSQGGWKLAQGGRQRGHANQGGQQQKACRYMEDCTRVPYCPYKHYNVDFPPLSEDLSQF